MRVSFVDGGEVQGSAAVRVQIRTGKVELGQGIVTAFTQIAADALQLRPEQVQVLAADTLYGPDEGITSGSLSIQDGGTALRAACIAARLAREKGSAPGDTAHTPSPLTVIGQSWPRLDLPAKFAGRPAFIHDMELPGLLCGRVLHPPQRDAMLIEDGVAAAMAAVQAVAGVLGVHRDGRLFGILAEEGARADVAAQRLAGALRWQLPASETLGADDTLQASMLQAVAADSPSAPSPTPQSASPAAEHGHLPTTAVARTLKASYSKPWIAHASLAPSCALAQWDGQMLRVWTHSQGIFNLRRDLALAFGLPALAVRVQHVDGAGCYGHNGADDVAFDAAWLARQAAGRPVRVLWSRADELGQAPFGPAMRMQLEADLDEAGQVLHWRHHVHSAGHSSRPGRSSAPALLGSWQTATPFAQPAAINMPLKTGGGAERNAVPGYSLPGWQVFSHAVIDTPLRSSALRSLGAFGNVFAAESFVDEICQATGDEPLAWRRRHLAHDPRALAVLELAALRAGWSEQAHGTPRSSQQDGPHHSTGRGIACARYKGLGAWCAVVAEVEAGATLRVRRLTIAVDVGCVINPDGVVSQIEGGAIQATSWALKEAVAHEGQRVTSDAWERYPILRFSEVPEVAVHILPSTQPWLGAGEASIGPTAAAIANALFDALGLRVRDLPLTPERIVAAMDEAAT